MFAIAPLRLLVNSRDIRCSIILIIILNNKNTYSMLNNKNTYAMLILIGIVRILIGFVGILI